LWRTYNSLGTAYARDGKLSEAIAEYRKALDIADDPMTRFNLASALSMSGQIKEAETHYQAAIKAKPDCVDYRNGYGMYLLTTGAADRALAQFKEAAALWPGSGETHANIGLALAQMGRTDEAMQSFNRSLEIDPNAMKTHYQVAGVLAGTGNLAGAIEHYERAHELSPENPVICNVLAWFRATAKDPSLRDGKQAVLLAETACAATAWKDPQTVDTLAAAYAECGQFDQAVTTARRALTVARKLGQSDVATRIDSRLKLYSSHKAYHEGM
jgi:tetratricopeptide (TPR) repeat protein